MVDKLHTKYILDETEMPKAWYNILPDLPKPLPPAIHPGTKQPAGPDDFAPLFPMALIGFLPRQATWASGSSRGFHQSPMLTSVTSGISAVGAARSR